MYGLVLECHGSLWSGVTGSGDGSAGGIVHNVGALIGDCELFAVVATMSSTLDVKTSFDLYRKMVCEFRRNSISNHFVSIVDLVVMEDKVIRERLDESALFDGQSAIEMFFSLLESKQIFVDLDHFWGLWMEDDMSGYRQECETLLMPSTNAIATHEVWRERFF